MPNARPHSAGPLPRWHKFSAPLSLGDRFGRRRALYAGLLLFGAGSAASAFSGSAGMLISTRAVMGLGAAIICPATLSIITNTFPDSERGQAIGIWASFAVVGILVGPVAGVWLLDHFWRDRCS